MSNVIYKRFDHTKYPKADVVDLRDRTWPNNVIESAPTWCSVDLRDGNQALIEPMTVDQKLALFDLLVEIGFKEIEVGFPAASQPDYDFVRCLIDEERIPDDVTIQVLTQAREHLIEKTFESLKGAKKACIHLYNSVSKVQREYVFKLDRDGITQIAVDGARLLINVAQRYSGTEFTYQYSPESFTGAELDYAVDVCNAVIAVFEPTPQQKLIVNLPATVETTTPNVYADRVEWFLKHVERRDSIILSVHTHNDRGCAVAASELAVLAGAQRVEGTLMGNGERTGNMDIITMGMNLYSQGVDPELNFSDMDRIIRVYEGSTQLPIHPRHPYVGDLVYTAFSGSHQDAIKKCLDQRDDSMLWEVAYLPIDPQDLGRDYQQVIRVNSQSGKGGIAYLIERDYGLKLPRWLQIEFSAVVQQFVEGTEKEVSSTEIYSLFKNHYLRQSDQYKMGDYSVEKVGEKDCVRAQLNWRGESKQIVGEGGGVIEAFIDGIKTTYGVDIEILDYAEHALTPGAESEAITYLNAKVNGDRFVGVAIGFDIIGASLDAILRVLNQAPDLQLAM